MAAAAANGLSGLLPQCAASASLGLSLLAQRARSTEDKRARVQQLLAEEEAQEDAWAELTAGVQAEQLRALVAHGQRIKEQEAAVHAAEAHSAAHLQATVLPQQGTAVKVMSALVLQELLLRTCISREAMDALDQEERDVQAAWDALDAARREENPLALPELQQHPRRHAPLRSAADPPAATATARAPPPQPPPSPPFQASASACREAAGRAASPPPPPPPARVDMANGGDDDDDDDDEDDVPLATRMRLASSFTCRNGAAELASSAPADEAAAAEEEAAPPAKARRLESGGASGSGGVSSTARRAANGAAAVALQLGRQDSSRTAGTTAAPAAPAAARLSRWRALMTSSDDDKEEEDEEEEEDGGGDVLVVGVGRGLRLSERGSGALAGGLAAAAAAAARGGGGSGGGARAAAPTVPNPDKKGPFHVLRCATYSSDDNAPKVLVRNAATGLDEAHLYSPERVAGLRTFRLLYSCGGKPRSADKLVTPGAWLVCQLAQRDALCVPVGRVEAVREHEPDKSQARGFDVLELQVRNVAPLPPRAAEATAGDDLEGVDQGRGSSWRNTLVRFFGYASRDANAVTVTTNDKSVKALKLWLLPRVPALMP